MTFPPSWVLVSFSLRWEQWCWATGAGSRAMAVFRDQRLTSCRRWGPGLLHYWWSQHGAWGGWGSPFPLLMGPGS